MRTLELEKVSEMKKKKHALAEMLPHVTGFQKHSKSVFDPHRVYDDGDK